MKNVVKFHESDTISAYNFDWKKKTHGRHIVSFKSLVNKYFKCYDRNCWFVPMVDGLNDWFYDDETIVVSPINWTIDREKLHIDNGIKGCIKVKGEFILKFNNIKRHKTKKYEVEIVIDNNVMDSHTWFGMEFKDCGRSYISIKGTSRVGYGRYDGSEMYSTSTECMFNATEMTADGDLYIHQDLRRKECFYVNHIGGFIGNKQITDEIYDKFIEVCNMMAIDAKKNFKKLKNQFHPSKKGEVKIENIDEIKENLKKENLKKNISEKISNNNMYYINANSHNKYECNGHNIFINITMEKGYRLNYTSNSFQIRIMNDFCDQRNEFFNIFDEEPKNWMTMNKKTFMKKMNQLINNSSIDFQIKTLSSLKCREAIWKMFSILRNEFVPAVKYCDELKRKIEANVIGA